MTTADYITLTVAIIGAVTGVIGICLASWSLYRQIEQDRVKLRVGASWGLAVRAPDMQFLIISVTNISKFPITLREVGLRFDEDKQRAIHPDVHTSDGGRLPTRMESRTTVTM